MFGLPKKSHQQRLAGTRKEIQTEQVEQELSKWPTAPRAFRKFLKQQIALSEEDLLHRLDTHCHELSRHERSALKNILTAFFLRNENTQQMNNLVDGRGAKGHKLLSLKTAQALIAKKLLVQSEPDLEYPLFHSASVSYALLERLHLHPKLQLIDNDVAVDCSSVEPSPAEVLWTYGSIFSAKAKVAVATTTHVVPGTVMNGITAGYMGTELAVAFYNYRVREQCFSYVLHDEKFYELHLPDNLFMPNIQQYEVVPKSEGSGDESSFQVRAKRYVEVPGIAGYRLDADRTICRIRSSAIVRQASDLPPLDSGLYLASKENQRIIFNRLGELNGQDVSGTEAVNIFHIYENSGEIFFLCRPSGMQDQFILFKSDGVSLSRVGPIAEVPHDLYYGALVSFSRDDKAMAILHRSKNADYSDAAFISWRETEHPFTAQHFFEVRNQVKSVILSPEGSCVATLSPDGQVEVFRKSEKGFISKFSFSHDPNAKVADFIFKSEEELILFEQVEESHDFRIAGLHVVSVKFGQTLPNIEVEFDFSESLHPYTFPVRGVFKVSQATHAVMLDCPLAGCHPNPISNELLTWDIRGQIFRTNGQTLERLAVTEPLGELRSVSVSDSGRDLLIVTASGQLIEVRDSNETYDSASEGASSNHAGGGLTTTSITMHGTPSRELLFADYLNLEDRIIKVFNQGDIEVVERQRAGPGLVTLQKFWVRPDSELINAKLNPSRTLLVVASDRSASGDRALLQGVRVPNKQAPLDDRNTFRRMWRVRWGYLPRVLSFSEDGTVLGMANCFAKLDSAGFKAPVVNNLCWSDITVSSQGGDMIAAASYRNGMLQVYSTNGRNKRGTFELLAQCQLESYITALSFVDNDTAIVVATADGALTRFGAA